jgi:hypothetical protein
MGGSGPLPTTHSPGIRNPQRHQKIADGIGKLAGGILTVIARKNGGG